MKIIRDYQRLTDRIFEIYQQWVGGMAKQEQQDLPLALRSTRVLDKS